MKQTPYLTAMGAWGDAIAAYGNMCHFHKENDLTHCKVIYYGMDPNIRGFLAAQEGVQDVLHIKPETREEFMTFVTVQSSTVENWSRISGISSEIYLTHVQKEHLVDNPKNIHRPICKLPPSEFILKDYDFTPYFKNRPRLLFQPYSTQSVSPIDHWPFWWNALEWLGSLNRFDVLVIGEKTGGMSAPGFVFPDLKIPNVLSMVGITQSMMDVFALAEHCDGIVTTSNGLSMWSIVRQIPALVLCNKLNQTHDYYNGWIRAPKNTLLGVNLSLANFKSAFLEWEKTI